MSFLNGPSDNEILKKQRTDSHVNLNILKEKLYLLVHIVGNTVNQGDGAAGVRHHLLGKVDVGGNDLALLFDLFTLNLGVFVVLK